MLRPVKSARKGMRVQCASYAAGVPVGTHGTVAPLPGMRNSNPQWVFVNWDNGQKLAVFKRELAKGSR